MTAPVLPDSNVLFSRTLRDWLCLLSAEGGLSTVHMTEDILAEVVSKYRDRFPYASGSQIERLQRHLRDHAHSVFSDYQPRPCGIPDVGDHHVHAAAEDGKMAYLVTADRGFLDLPEEVTQSFGYEIYSPDEFFCFADDSNPRGVRATAVEQALYWARKQDGVHSDGSLVDALRRSGCPAFAERVAVHLDEALRSPAPAGPQRFFIATPVEGSDPQGA